MNSKICKKHGEISGNDLYTGVYKGKNFWQCKICKRERMKTRYKETVMQDEELLAQKREKDRQYWQANKEKIKQRRIENDDNGKRREAYKRNQAYYNRNCKDKQKQYRDKLHPSYIKKIIRGDNWQDIPAEEIPESLIRIKTKLVEYKRKLGIKTLVKKLEQHNVK